MLLAELDGATDATGVAIAGSETGDAISDMTVGYILASPART